MKSIITDSFRHRIIKNIKNSFSESGSSLYLFYARSLPWNTGDEVVPDLNGIRSEETIIKSNILALKKIGAKDSILGVAKYQWQENTIYEAYTNNDTIKGKNFYVITDENRVYKCLNNNKIDGYPRPSTVKPVYETGEPFHLSDGYTWVYLYTLSTGVFNKFNTANFIPIDIAEPNNSINRVPGVISSVEITNAGSGYSLIGSDNNPVNEIPILFFGNGEENSSGKIRIDSVNTNGTININNSNPVRGYSGFTIINRGSKYTYNDGKEVPIYIKQLNPNASATNIPTEFSYAYGYAIINDAQQIEKIRLINGGLNYISNLEADVILPSAIAYAKISTDDGHIEKITINQFGNNYSYADAYIITDKIVDPNTDAVINPVLSPVFGHGSNIENELFATNLIFNVKIAYEEIGNKFSTQNDFRTIGVIENIFRQDSDGTNKAIANELTIDAKEKLVLDDISEFEPDQTVYGVSSGALGKIVDIIESENAIRIIRNNENSNTASFLLNEPIISGAGSALIQSISLSEYVPYTGEILFINNREPISRAPEQIENITFIIEL